MFSISLTAKNQFRNKSIYDRPDLFLNFFIQSNQQVGYRFERGSHKCPYFIQLQILILHSILYTLSKF